MGEKYSVVEKTKNGFSLNRVNLTAATTIEGCNVVWNISSAAGGAFDVTVAEYKPSRTAQYNLQPHVVNRPYIIVKCAADCSANNVAVKSSDGAGGTTTHYTFAADYSGTPRYVVLRVASSKAADGTYIWEVA